MEFCDGGSLAELTEKGGGTISCEAAVPILLQCLDGIEYAHQAKIVHRDLKPANILLSHSNAKSIAKVADLGLAKNFEHAGYSGLTMSGSVGGSFGFMPREQLTNYRDAKPVSDIWSLAATFYDALTGFTPLDFPSPSEQNWLSGVYNAILNDEPVPIRARDRAVPPRLDQVIDRALSVDPQSRYQSAGEMKADVLAFKR